MSKNWNYNRHQRDRIIRRRIQQCERQYGETSKPNRYNKNHPYTLTMWCADDYDDGARNDAVRRNRIYQKALDTEQAIELVDCQ